MPASSDRAGACTKTHTKITHKKTYDYVFTDFCRISSSSDSQTYCYNLNQWARVYTEHGRTVLGLSMAYDVLSLWLLDVGIVSLDVPLVEEYPGCFLQMPEGKKVDILRALVARDFQVNFFTLQN